MECTLVLLTLCSGQRWQPSLMRRGFHRSCAGASQNRTRDPRSTTRSKGISRSWKKTFQSLGVLSSFGNAKKNIFLTVESSPPTILRSPSKPHLHVEPDNEQWCWWCWWQGAWFQEHQKTKSTKQHTHTHTHTHRRMKQLWSLRLAPVVFLYVHLLLF